MCSSSASPNRGGSNEGGPGVCRLEFAGAVRLHPKAKDPMIGTQDPAESIFVIPQVNGAPPIKITGFSSFITTKAAAYCFLPSITAVKFISKLVDHRNEDEG
jgi:hypothetical protein